MNKWTAEEVRARFEAAMREAHYLFTWDATAGIYEEQTMRFAWFGFQAAFAERIKADEAAGGRIDFKGMWNDMSDRATTHPPAQAAQVDKPPKLGGCCCGEPCVLGSVHRTDGPCFVYDAPTAEPVAQGEVQTGTKGRFITQEGYVFRAEVCDVLLHILKEDGEFSVIGRDEFMTESEYKLATAAAPGESK